MARDFQRNDRARWGTRRFTTQMPEDPGCSRTPPLPGGRERSHAEGSPATMGLHLQFRCCCCCRSSLVYTRLTRDREAKLVTSSAGQKAEELIHPERPPRSDRTILAKLFIRSSFELAPVRGRISKKRSKS